MMRATEQTASAIVLRCYVSPNASKNEVVGLFDGRLKIKIAAPPADNKANNELMKFLAKLFKLKKSSVSLIRGQSSRHKDLLCEGLGEDQVAQLMDEISNNTQNAR